MTSEFPFREEDTLWGSLGGLVNPRYLEIMLDNKRAAACPFPSWTCHKCGDKNPPTLVKLPGHNRLDNWVIPLRRERSKEIMQFLFCFARI